ncbi:MAG TPA: LytTR family DNA-binding domain-containing protein [Puia sp.]|nr:LytTR family DNA-binding domain-containing protein [Puia sp.]
MDRISAIIIDDEKKSRMSLLQKLQSYCPTVEIVGEAANGPAGKELIESLKPDLVFLDIVMPRMNGFEMIASLSHRNFEIIFTTAYSQYAIQAIRYSAFDYLLKPVDIEDLRNAIQKIGLKIAASDKEERLMVLLQNLSNEKERSKRIVIPTAEGLLFISVDDIIHLEASSNYTFVYFLHEPRLVACRTLKEFEEMLPDSIFFRIHHSHIININAIKKITRDEGNRVELTNGNVVDISRRRKDEFLKMLGQ